MILAKTYYCPYRSGGVYYPQFDLYNDGVKVNQMTSFRFQTKGRNDAHLLLQYDRNNYYSNVIEIVIGGWGNSQSVIRNSQQGTNRATHRVVVDFFFLCLLLSLAFVIISYLSNRTIVIISNYVPAAYSSMDC